MGLNSDASVCDVKFMIIYLPDPYSWVESDTRSIFKRSLTGLNSGFSFLQRNWHTKVKEAYLPNYLLEKEWLTSYISEGYFHSVKFTEPWPQFELETSFQFPTTVTNTPFKFICFRGFGLLDKYYPNPSWTFKVDWITPYFGLVLYCDELIFV